MYCRRTDQAAPARWTTGSSVLHSETPGETSDRLVVAVIVTFNPDRQRLLSLVASLQAQVAEIVIVDNGAASPFEGPPGVTLLQQGENTGIATAQNAGVATARQRGATFVVFFDQDSQPVPTHVSALHTAYERGVAAGLQIAAIGPIPVDKRLWRRPSVGGRAAPAGLLDVDHVISSGALIPLAAFDRVGPLRDDLFIDYVDTEWCLRAGREGLRSYIEPALEMSHEFGTPMRALGIAVSSRSPMRHYYLVRNSIWLWNQGWVPLRWKLVKGVRLAARLLIAVLFSRPHLEHWSMMARGVRDGLAGRMGRRH